MYLTIPDNSGDVYHVPIQSVAYLKESVPIGKANIVYKIVLTCEKQIIVTEQQFTIVQKTLSEV
jgi:hypothetical protein